jgi:hypothetical protein
LNDATVFVYLVFFALCEKKIIPMKKLKIFCVLCAFVAITKAQPNYPTAPPPSGNISNIEFFVDSKPEFGSGSALTGFTPSPNVNAFSGIANIGTLAQGFHRIYFRSKDVDGKWSFTNSAYFDNYTVPVYATAPAAATSITNIEYFMDNKPEFGTGTVLTGFTPSTNINTFNGTANFGVLPQGFHRFYIRSKDADGKWSITNNTFFDNYTVPVYNTAPAPVTNITQLEYFIDNYIPFGSGIQIPIVGNTTNIANLNANINVTGLLQGVHRLYIRSKDANGKWSLTNFSVFDNSITPNYPVAPTTAPAIANMEYFIDTDPGFGAATPLTVPANSGDINSYSISLNLSGSLSNGTHYLNIRSKQNPWSLTTVVPFNATVTTSVTWLYVKAQVTNNATQISWATATETNTNNFEIEWSSDGISFSKIGTVAAAGNSSIVRNYNFNHNNPTTGFNYYRIKQIDLNGTFKYSVMVKVLNNKNIKQTIIAPNPVVDVLTIIEPKYLLVRVIAVYDTKGVLVLQKTINTQEQVYSIPVSTLAQGNYVIKVQYQNEVKTYSFIKK